MSTLNKEYAKKISKTCIQFAKADMSAEQLSADGFVKYIDVMPPVKDGFVIQHDDYVLKDIDDGKVLEHTYTYKQKATKTNRYKICELFWWIAQHGKATQLDDFLKSQGLYSAAITQTEVSDDDANFTTVLEAVKIVLSLTDDEIQECLTAAKVK